MGKEAYKDWPPKNGVVIFEPMVEDSEEGAFFMDIDDFEAMEKAQDEEHARMEARREEARRYEREMTRYDRDDD